VADRSVPRSLAGSALDFDPSDPAWPSCLGELDDPPPRLRVAGTLPFLDRAVAIVGTRRASADGLELAARIARELAEVGYVVISGGAEGIDAAAHRGALEGGGLGVAVLAGGLARPYPRAHAPLFERIAQSGAVISEAADEEEPRTYTFLARNRLIAALARAVVVVQAPFRSGAMSTAKHARDLGRPLLALPWAITDPLGEGCLALLDGGARLCRSSREVRSALGETLPRRRVRAPRKQHPLDPEQEAVLAALGAHPRHVDDVVRATGLPPAQVQFALMTLTLLGAVLPDDRGAYRRAG
jgi:DNA processing protein